MKVKVDGREYPFNGELTGREVSTIKRISGIRLAELDDAISAGDYDVYVAFAVIAMGRAGVLVSEDDLLDRPASAIEFIVEEEDEADPPVEEPEVAAPRAGKKKG